MTDKDKIVEFEDLFKDDRKKRLEDIIEPERKNRYSLSIFVYFIVMFILQLFIYVLIFNMPAFQASLTEQEALLDTLVYDVDGMVFLEDNLDGFDDYVLNLGLYEGYHVYVNALNTGRDLLFDDSNIFMPSVIEQIMMGEITTWDNNRLIVVYKGATQTYGFSYTLEFDQDDLIAAKITLTSLGLNIINFLTYVFLVPWVVILLKLDLFKDFKMLKGLKSQLLSLVVTGYLFVILGNLISNGISQALSLLLGVDMQMAINQITIVRALNSPGMPLMLLSAIILGPVVEELIFRKAMFGLIRNVKVALIVSSLTFGAIHLLNEASLAHALVNGMSYFVMGFVFGYIYLRSNKNIWIPIFVHVLSNLIAILAILFLPI